MKIGLPSASFFLKQPIVTKSQASDWIATVCKVGTLPLAPGTWGSLVAVITWYFIIDFFLTTLFILLTAVIFGVGVITSTIVEKESGSQDPSRVVIDEWTGQWIALMFLPKLITYAIVSFLLFRFFDILKPWPISRLDRLPGGWGIMADDVGAGLATIVLIKGYLVLFA